MSNHVARYDCECCDCGETIAQGDDIWFCDDGKLCEACADSREIACPECGGQKSPQFETCYACKISAEEAEENGLES